jgi:hypothetical protein
MREQSELTMHHSVGIVLAHRTSWPRAPIEELPQLIASLTCSRVGKEMPYSPEVAGPAQDGLSLDLTPSPSRLPRRWSSQDSHSSPVKLTWGEMPTEAVDMPGLIFRLCEHL